VIPRPVADSPFVITIAATQRIPLTDVILREREREREREEEEEEEEEEDISMIVNRDDGKQQCNIPGKHHESMEATEARKGLNAVIQCKKGKRAV
jgi:hypothetical protein